MKTDFTTPAFLYCKTACLISDYNEIKNDAKKMEHFMSLYAALQAYLGMDYLPNTAELLGIYGRVIVSRTKLNL